MSAECEDPQVVELPRPSTPFDSRIREYERLIGELEDKLWWRRHVLKALMIGRDRYLGRVADSPERRARTRAFVLSIARGGPWRGGPADDTPGDDR